MIVESITAKVIGVLCLRLEEEDSLALFGNKRGSNKQLFEIAAEVNIDGIVCSPHELK